MYRIATPTCTLHAFTHCLDKEVDEADLLNSDELKHQGGGSLCNRIDGLHRKSSIPTPPPDNFFDDDLSTKGPPPTPDWGNYFGSRGGSDVRHAVPLHGKQPLTAAPPHFAQLDG